MPTRSHAGYPQCANIRANPPWLESLSMPALAKVSARRMEHNHASAAPARRRTRNAAIVSPLGSDYVRCSRPYTSSATRGRFALLVVKTSSSPPRRAVVSPLVLLAEGGEVLTCYCTAP